MPAAGSCGLPAGTQVRADNRFWTDPTQDWWIYLEADFGYWGPTPSISGAIWYDRDADGRDDGAEEPPLPRVPMAVVDAAGKTLAATTADAQGAYAFAALPEGAHAVQVTDNGGRLEGYRLAGGLDAYPLPAPGEPGFDNMTQINLGYVRDGRRVAAAARPGWTLTEMACMTQRRPGVVRRRWGWGARPG